MAAAVLPHQHTLCFTLGHTGLSFRGVERCVVDAALSFQQSVGLLLQTGFLALEVGGVCYFHPREGYPGQTKVCGAKTVLAEVQMSYRSDTFTEHPLAQW